MRLKVISEDSSHWVELQGANGKILMFSENYFDLSGAKRAAKNLSVKLNLHIVYEKR